MGRCRLDGFSSGCGSGANLATKKATASRSLSDPTTRPLYQGAGSRKNETRRAAGCKCSYKPHLRSAGGAGSNPRGGIRLFASNLAVMKNEEFLCPFCVCCVQKSCKLWQILHDQALKFVADISLLFDFGPFTFRNIAHGKKRSYI